MQMPLVRAATETLKPMAVKSSTSASLAVAPSPPAGLAAGAPSAAPACRGLARRGCRAALLPEDVEMEEEAADLAAALACRGSPTSIVSESRMQGAVRRRADQNKVTNDDFRTISVSQEQTH